MVPSGKQKSAIDVGAVAQIETYFGDADGNSFLGTTADRQAQGHLSPAHYLKGKDGPIPVKADNACCCGHDPPQGHWQGDWSSTIEGL